MDRKKEEYELLTGLRERLANGAQTEDEVIIMQLMSLIDDKNSELKEAASLLRARSEDLKQMEESSRRDALTGLYNRKAIKPYFESIIENKENLQSLQIVAIDLDHFKSINDTYGHSAGDDALRIVSDGITRFFKKRDLIVRPGGDEFFVVVKNCPSSVLRYKLDQMCEYIGECVNKDLDSRARNTDGQVESIERPYDYTVSCGISEMDISKLNADLMEKANEEAFNSWFQNEYKLADDECYAVKEEHHSVRR